jgi:hypothetical protein
MTMKSYFRNMAFGRKVVRTTLTKDEYKVFVETLSRKQLSIQEGLRGAALKLIEEENKPDPGDSFFKIKPPSKGSGHGDLSLNHDRFLFGKKNLRKVKRHKALIRK